ncbi:MAG: Thymidylate kinase [Firmicutes bacterium ADurb.Bin506]|nr:MAG: Thymidylate kinase [Firmicutes bacterium ADurb.Bin506]
MIIALEGGEGCGKGTIAKWLNEEHGFIELHDPGSSPLSLQMREILLHKTDLDMDDRQLALAFEVCHADNLKQAMKYAANGSNVVLDRTYLSNYAHRMAKGMPMAHLKILNQLFLPETACVEKILYLACPWEARKARMLARPGGGKDRFESRGDQFHLDVERAYDSLAASGMAVRLDASGDVASVKRLVAAQLGLTVA